MNYKDKCRYCIHCNLCQIEGFYCDLDCVEFNTDDGLCEDFEEDISYLFVKDNENFEQEISTLDNIYG